MERVTVVCSVSLVSFRSENRISKTQGPKHLFAWHAFLDSCRCLRLRHKRNHKSDSAGLKGIMRKHQILIFLQRNHDMTSAEPRGKQAATHTNFLHPLNAITMPILQTTRRFQQDMGDVEFNICSVAQACCHKKSLLPCF